MYNLSSIDDTNFYVCPEFENQTTKNIINTDKLNEFLVMRKWPVSTVSIDDILFRRIVFQRSRTQEILDNVDVDNYDPIILLTGITLPEKYAFLCIDGKHRLNRIYKEHHKSCRAYVVNITDIGRYIF